MSTMAAHAPGRIGRSRFSAVGGRPAAHLGARDRYRFLLLLRFLLINATGMAFLTMVWMQGWVARILAADDTNISKLIFGLFVVGLVWTGQRVVMLSRELNALEEWPLGSPSRVGTVLREISGRDGATRAALMGALRLKLIHRITPVRHMASTLVLLGLIGTIVGLSLIHI